MSDTVDRTIAALRDHHDRLAEVVDRLSPEELDGPSAAEKWSRAQVLSHLGSGAEIFSPRYAAAISGETPDLPDNQEIWARWDDSSSQEQAQGFVEHDEAFVATLEGLDEEQRRSLTVDLGFGPDRWPLDVALALRLNEVAAHTWDVLAGLDPATPLDDEAAQILLASYAGPGSFVLGWMGKPDLDRSVTVGAGDYTLVLGDDVSLVPGADQETTAAFHGPREALIRLLLGRLKDGYTAPDVRVDGDITLEDLRRIFPGY